MHIVQKVSNIYLKIRYISKTSYSTVKLSKNCISKIRNIGISAHIDAGKTTTTERMLYYAGLIDSMGEVHQGNTFTDFMEQERERGITITSAAVTFLWKGHQFNLIDTPGHIDFTMEVEQTLNVIDGVVVILDGSAGVEAQTLTVWRQAERYNIPQIIYVNKMDRNDADIHMCCASVEKKLDVPTVLLQLPAVQEGKLIGLIDALSLELVQFGTTKDKVVSRVKLAKEDYPELLADAQEARVKVIEQLSDYDDEFANKVISSESLDGITTVEIVRALQTVTENKVAVPVLLGSSYKNIGVQSLMDAIVLYLPSPERRSKVFSSFEDSFCGRAFKVKHDKQRGPLVFVRLYNGIIKKGQKIFNVQKGESEQVGRIYVPYANELKEVQSLENGNIAVFSGLKKLMSGDLVTSSQGAYDRARKNLLKRKEISGPEQIESNADTLFGMGARIPEPVFFRSIESSSMVTQSSLDQALSELQREDPSLRVSYNSETGQTVLAGMGELHLEVIRDRILREYKLEAELGPLQISYREAPLDKITDSISVDTKIGDHKNSVFVKLSLIPVDSVSSSNVLKFDKSSESASNISAIFSKYLVAIKQGVDVGLAQGPKINSQIVNTHVMLHWFEVGRGTSDTIIASTVTSLVQKLLKQSGTCILEPVVLLEVITPSEHLTRVLSDLSRRRTSINDVSVRGDAKVVTATTPLSEMLGYSTDLRTLTSGTAAFTAEFSHYQKMSQVDEDDVVKKVRGF